MNKMRLLVAAVAAVFCVPVAVAAAAFSVDNVFGDHMVLQRAKPVRISGSGQVGLPVTVAFRGETRKVIADGDGRWVAEFPAGQAGGPFDLKVTPGWNGNHALVFKDILVGEVWVCSGQSNMEFPVCGNRFYSLPDGEEVAAAAHDGKLRLLQGLRSMNVDGPASDLTGRPSWKPATSRDAVAPFSAIGYYFGSKLRKALDEDVPVGMINISWGGSRIEPWIPEAAFRAAGNTAVVEAIETNKTIPDEEAAKSNEAKVQIRKERFLAWMRAFVNSEPEKSAPALKDWAKPGLSLDGWTRGPRTKMLGLETPGIAWYRFPFDIPAGWEKDELVFHMDFVNDADETFLDGVKIGETGPLVGTKNYWAAPRDYTFRARPGSHVLAVRAQDHMASGGIGKEIYVKNRRTGEKIDFDGVEWCERIEFRADQKKLGERPDPEAIDGSGSRRTSSGSATCMYNAMVHPVSQMNVAGAIWYQGCSNAGEPAAYIGLQKTLIDGWRAAFRDPTMPFVITQLSALESHRPASRLPDDFWTAVTPGDLGFARLRAAQDVMRDYPQTGVVCTIDIGDHSDIHPARKEQAAERLLGEALRLKYGKGAAPGPHVGSVRREGTSLVVTLKDVGSGLVAKGGEMHPHMFALAGGDEAFYWAQAELVDGSTLRVWSEDVKEPVAVRYAFSAYPPKVTLYRRDDDLPLFPFEARVGE